MFLVLNEKSQKENEKIKELSENYKEFIKEKNELNKSASKNFYIVIKEKIKEFQKEDERILNEKISKTALNENFFKIKEALSRCGNIVYDFTNKDEVVLVLNSFITTKNSVGEEW